MKNLARALVIVSLIPIAAYAGDSRAIESERLKCEFKDGVLMCTFKATGERLRLSWDEELIGEDDD